MDGRRRRRRRLCRRRNPLRATTSYVEGWKAVGDTQAMPLYAVQALAGQMALHMELPSRLPDRIGLQEPSQWRRIISRAVVVEPCLGIEIHADILERLAGERTADAVEIIRVRTFNRCTAGARRGDDAAMMVGVVILDRRARSRAVGRCRA
jgi:hypothetical protein